MIGIIQQPYLQSEFLDDEEAQRAATKIQAGFRGKRARRKIQADRPKAGPPTTKVADEKDSKPGTRSSVVNRAPARKVSYCGAENMPSEQSACGPKTTFDESKCRFEDKTSEFGYLPHSVSHDEFISERPHSEPGFSVSFAMNTRSPNQHPTSSSTGRPRFYHSFSTRSGISPAQAMQFRSCVKAKPTRWPRRVQEVRIWLYLLFEEPGSSKYAQAVSIFILTCILFSIVLFVAETQQEIKWLVQSNIWTAMETFCTMVFTLEYGLRLFVCDISGKSVCSFLRRPMNIVDVVAISPFYIWVVMQNVNAVRALSVLRTIRLVRLFRILKLGRYSTGLQLMMTALKNSSQAALVLCFFLVIGVVLFSSLIYYAEKISCPLYEDLAVAPAKDGSNRTQWQEYMEECHATARESSSYGICCDEHGASMMFPTIIEAFWWSIVTMTTVGFGDMTPQTVLGQYVGTVTMLAGILLIALPIAIIGRKFQEAYDAQMLRKGTPKPRDEDRKKADMARGMYVQMGRHLRRIPFGDPDMNRMSFMLSKQLDEMAQIQKEMWSMEKHEHDRQGDALRSFDQILDHFLENDRKRSMMSVVKRAKGPGTSRSGKSIGSVGAALPVVPTLPNAVPDPAAAKRTGNRGVHLSSQEVAVKATATKPVKGILKSVTMEDGETPRSVVN